MPKRTPEYMAAQRDRILEAALKCFADQGFHQTSTMSSRGRRAVARAPFMRISTRSATSSKRHRARNAALRDLRRAQPAQLEKYVADSFDNLQTPRMRQVLALTLHMAAESLSDPDYLAWQDRLTKRYIAWVEPLVRTIRSGRAVRPAGRRRGASFDFLLGRAGALQMLSPDLPATLLRSDMAAVAPAIIKSARRPRNELGGRLRPNDLLPHGGSPRVRQTNGTKRRSSLSDARRRPTGQVRTEVYERRRVSQGMIAEGFPAYRNRNKPRTVMNRDER